MSKALLQTLIHALAFVFMSSYVVFMDKGKLTCKCQKDRVLDRSHGARQSNVCVAQKMHINFLCPAYVHVNDLSRVWDL